MADSLDTGSFVVASWNVNFRRDVAHQVDALLASSPDVVVLQEVRAAGFAEFAERLGNHGLPHFATSASSVSGRQMGRYVAVASRFAFDMAAPVDSPAPETSVCLDVHAPGGSFDLVGVYVPSIARRDGLKVPTQLAMNARMAGASARPHLICGDFNSPKAESAAGVTLFSKPVRSEEYAGEHALMGGLEDLGLRDAFRACNGWEVAEPSWFWKNRGRSGGYRLDHIWVSPHFELMRCWYDHSVRELGLSDHSAMFAEVALRHSARATG